MKFFFKKYYNFAIMFFLFRFHYDYNIFSVVRFYACSAHTHTHTHTRTENMNQTFKGMLQEFF